MPEGDSLHRTASALRRALLARIVTGFRCRRSEARELARRGELVGREVTAVVAAGKHLVVVFRRVGRERGTRTLPLVPEVDLRDDDLVLRTHLGLHGSWHLYRPGERWQRPEAHAAVSIETADFVTPCFAAPEVELRTGREMSRSARLAALGPDATSPDFDVDAAVARFRAAEDRPIGEALLDQRLVSGIGNIWKSETLFARRTSPFRKVSELPDDELRELLEAAHRGLAASADPAKSLRRPRAVYRRSGAPCRVCSVPIRMERQGSAGRSTYFCPRCQAVEGR